MQSRFAPRAAPPLAVPRLPVRTLVAVTILHSMSNVDGFRAGNSASDAENALSGIELDQDRTQAGVSGTNHHSSATAAASPDSDKSPHLRGPGIDLAPLFLMQEFVDWENPIYGSMGSQFKCCCKETKCKIGRLEDKNKCDTPLNPRNRSGCGCVAGMGYKSFLKVGDGKCWMTWEQVYSLPMWEPLGIKATPQERAEAREKVKADVEFADRTRIVDGVTATYGTCSTQCGKGFRQLVKEETTGKLTLPMSEIKQQLHAYIDCIDDTGCEWSCERSACGWGTPVCKDADGKDGTFCDERATQDLSFPTKENFLIHSCYQPCDTGKSLQTVCTVAANHLDEQYGSVHNLVHKTCFDGFHDSQIQNDDRHQMVVLLTQELNHAVGRGVADGSMDFDKFVFDGALVGYVLAAECNDVMSAGVAVYIRHDMQHHVLKDSTTCSGTQFRSDCGWTNCKGTMVMSVQTTAGQLVVASMHLARGPKLSEKRVQEFEDALHAVTTVEPWVAEDNRKIVIMGGDINVRSDFGSEDVSGADFPLPVAKGIPVQGAQVDHARGLDVLGVENFTVDDHLHGDGLSRNASQWKHALRALNLKQMRDWRKLCPTYRKSTYAFREVEEEVWDGQSTRTNIFGTMKKVKETRTVRNYNLQCITPIAQKAGGHDDVEYLDVKRMGGSKSRTPSWTMRIIMSNNLRSGCGLGMKDTRHKNTDHDPVFVHCLMSL